jgi:hypothetical protein
VFFRLALGARSRCYDLKCAVGRQTNPIDRRPLPHVSIKRESGLRLFLSRGSAIEFSNRKSTPGEGTITTRSVLIDRRIEQELE